MNLSDIITLLCTLSGILTAVGGIGIIIYRKQNRRLKDAEARLAELNVDNAVSSGYEMRLTALHTIIQNCNKIEIEHSQRIAELNHSLNDKTDRIRELTDKGYRSERELNVANARITRLTEQRDEERRLKEYYKNWRCEKSVCRDPEGRIPPNAVLSGVQYKHPEKE